MFVLVEIEFDKMQIPLDKHGENPILIENCVATIGVCILGVASIEATPFFDFILLIEKIESLDLNDPYFWDIEKPLRTEEIQCFLLHTILNTKIRILQHRIILNISFFKHQNYASNVGFL